MATATRSRDSGACAIGTNAAFNVVLTSWLHSRAMDAKRSLRAGLLFLLLLVPGGRAGAQLLESGRLLATSGVTQIEGSGGGGLVPWALISGYGTNDAVGANVHDTFAYFSDFTLDSAGTSVGLYDRVELSYAHEWLDTRQAGARLGIGRGFTINEDVAGAKVRLVGDAVYDQDSLLPQIAAGVQLKSNDAHAVLHAIGAKSSRGADFYVAATKLFLAQSVLVNATVRLTKANQFGLLGFGGDRAAGYQPEFEGSLAYLFTRQLAVGAELRTKPNNLHFAHEGPAFDLFAAYFVNKNLSVTLAYVDLGTVARQGSQNGVYLSLQAGF